MEEKIKYDEEKEGGILIIRMREEKLTSHEAPAMKTEILRWLMSDCESIVINFKNVDYMDSTGLGALLFGIRQAERYDKELVFCEINSRITSLMKIARIDNVIDLYKTEKTALRELEKK